MTSILFATLKEKGNSLVVIKTAESFSDNEKDILAKAKKEAELHNFTIGCYWKETNGNRIFMVKLKGANN